MTTYGLLDTSFFIAQEQHRPINIPALPEKLAVSVVTVAELHAGVHAARDTETRYARMTTLDRLAEFETQPIDADAAIEFARMGYRVRESRRRVNVNDLWIAAVARARGLVIVTQDNDFDVLEEFGGPPVIRV